MTETFNEKYKIKINPTAGKEKSQIEIEAEIPWEVLEKYRDAVLKEMSEQIEISGFRRGHVPENILINRVGEMKVMSKTAEKAVREIYPQIIIENKIDAIGEPIISITKIANKNPLCFKIITIVMPEINLPDYKKIVEEMEAIKNEVITEKEVEETISYILEQWIKMEKFEKEKISPSASRDLPELDDEFVKKLGDYKNVGDFKIKLKENLQNEKIAKEKEKRRIQILEKISGGTKIEVPEIFIESELNKMMGQFKGEVEALKFNFKEYLEKIKKTEEEMRKEWRPGAESRAKTQLILNKIAEVEKIVADPEQITREVAKILEHYKDADPERATLYAQNVLANEKVFQFLENQ